MFFFQLLMIKVGAKRIKLQYKGCHGNMILVSFNQNVTLCLAFWFLTAQWTVTFTHKYLFTNSL